MMEGGTTVRDGEATTVPRSEKAVCLPPLYASGSPIWSMESSDSGGRSHQRTPLRSTCSTTPGHRGSQPVPGPCRHYCHGTLLLEAGLHVAVGAGSASSHPAMPRLPGEEPEDPRTEGRPPSECPSRPPLSGLEYGCAGARTCQFGRSSVLAHVEGRLQQVV